MWVRSLGGEDPLDFSRGSSQLEIKPRSPTVQADSLPAEPPGKPMTESNSCEKSRFSIQTRTCFECRNKEVAF